MEDVKPANKKLPNGSASNQPPKQKCRAPSPPKLNSQILINNSDKEKKLAPLPPKTIEISGHSRPNERPSEEDGRTGEDEHSLSQPSNDLSHVSVVTIGKDAPIIKTSAPKIKNENKTIFQVENEQNMSFLSNSRNQNATGKHSSDKDHSDYNHRQQQSISPKPPPSSGGNQQFLISSRQSILVSEQPFNEKDQPNHRRSRPSSYHEMTQQQESSRELSRESSGRETNRESSSKTGSRHSKVDKLQQINDKLNETSLNSPKQKRTASSSSATKCTKTDQASLELAQRNVKREPSNAGSLSSVESNQHSITRNSKIIEKGMAMVQLRKNKVGDKVSCTIGGNFFLEKKVFF